MALRPSLLIVFFPFLFHIVFAKIHHVKTFNVLRYGARPNTKTDNSQAFLRAWNDACGWQGRSRVVVPRGRFVVAPVVFVGPCAGPVEFVIRGTLRAANGSYFVDHWISFMYVDRLVVQGGGSLYGEGSSAWHYNDCAINARCRPLPVTMRFDFVTNSIIRRIRSIDSKNAHFNLFSCHNVNMTNLHITAPSDSPNTDGIRIGSSTEIRIQDSTISTGDDCVSIIAGSQNILVSGVTCGPGHGFSIGSLGGSHTDEHVVGVTITNSTLTGTQNGLRIKTWAPSLPSVASDLMFDDILMDNVNNPIFIDQQYCPQPPCNDKEQSRVQIRNVTYKKIRGTSSTKIAVRMQCSGLVPCQDVKLVNINLAYDGPEGPVESSCLNVNGKSYGHQHPSGCL